MGCRLIAAAVGGAIWLAGPALAQPAVPAPSAANAAGPNRSFATEVYQIDVARPAAAAWARVGRFCDSAEWGIHSCALMSGAEEQPGSVWLVGGTAINVIVASTDLSYTFAAPPQAGAPYNFLHATLEARPLAASTSRLIFSLFYDASDLDAAGRARVAEGRRPRYMARLENMKVLAEGGALPPARLTPAPPRLPFAVPNPLWVSYSAKATVGRPADAVWAKVGKFCSVTGIGIPCVVTSGDGERAGSTRRVNGFVEAMVANTARSYTYVETTAPSRPAPYNFYHGTLEVRPLTASTSELVRTVLYDASLLADDAARAREVARRRERMTEIVGNLKILAEGGTPPPARPFR